MKKRTKCWLAVAGVCLAGFVGLNILAYNHAYAMTHFTAEGERTHKPEKLSLWNRLRVLSVGVNIPRPSGDRQPSDLSADCRSLSVAGPGKVTLSVWYVDRGEETPLVILFHGYASDKTSQLQEAGLFLGMNASVLLVDFRGSGGSSESYTTIGVDEAEDVAAVTRYAHDNLLHPAVFLFGQSMGAVAILRAVDKLNVAPDGVVLESVFDTMLNTVRNRFAVMGVPSFPGAQLLVLWGGWQFGFNGFANKPVEYSRSLTCPSLFMHGASDPRATVAEGRRVYEAAPGPKEFKVFKSVGHESCVSACPEEWRAAVSTIIDLKKNEVESDQR